MNQGINPFAGEEARLRTVLNELNVSCYVNPYDGGIVICDPTTERRYEFTQEAWMTGGDSNLISVIKQIEQDRLDKAFADASTHEGYDSRWEHDHAPEVPAGE